MIIETSNLSYKCNISDSKSRFTNLLLCFIWFLFRWVTKFYWRTYLNRKLNFSSSPIGREKMAKVRDRTEDFKDSVRRAALNLGYNEVPFASHWLWFSIMIFQEFPFFFFSCYIECMCLILVEWLIIHLKFVSYVYIWQSKTARIMASFIFHKTSERSPFTKAALKTVSIPISYLYLAVPYMLWSCLW